MSKHMGKGLAFGRQLCLQPGVPATTDLLWSTRLNVFGSIRRGGSNSHLKSSQYRNKSSQISPQSQITQQHQQHETSRSQQLLRRASDILSSSSPQLLIGISIDRGCLGYTILDQNRTTLKLGMLELHHRKSTKKQSLDLTGVSSIITKTFSQIKQSYSHLNSSESSDAADGNHLDRNSADKFWSIGIGDGLRLSGTTSAAEKFAIEQRIHGIIMMELGQIFGTSVSSVGTTDARRLLGKINP